MKPKYIVKGTKSTEFCAFDFFDVFHLEIHMSSIWKFTCPSDGNSHVLHLEILYPWLQRDFLLFSNEIHGVFIVISLRRCRQGSR